MFVENFVNFLCSKYIVYTKILQWINFDKFPFIGKSLTKYLRSFTDNSPYIDSDIDYESLQLLEEKALNEGYQINLNKVPINSGTLSLVFKGSIIKDNIETKIAVKILRNNITNKITNALNFICWITYYFDYLPFISKIRLNDFFVNSRNKLLEQVDFNKEIESIEIVYNMCKLHKGTKQTNVIKSLSSEKVIVMTFIEGKSIFKLTQIEKEEFVEPFSKTLLHIFFRKSTFHLDLHPGNILFVTENNKRKISILDMGMIFIVSNEENDLLFDLFGIVYGTVGKEIIYNILEKRKKLLVDGEFNTNIFLDDIYSRYPLIFQIKNIRSIAEDFGILFYELNCTNCRMKPKINELLVGFVSFLGFCDLFNTDGKFIESLGKKLILN